MSEESPAHLSDLEWSVELLRGAAHAKERTENDTMCVCRSSELVKQQEVKLQGSMETATWESVTLS